MSTSKTKPDQWFTFGPCEFDIDKALEIIGRDADRPTRTIDVLQWAKMLGVEKTLAEYHAEGVLPMLRGEIDEEYARTKSDLSVPVIVADIRVKQDGEPAHMLIDGTHRLRRAFLEGVLTLPAYVLTFKESRAIRSDVFLGPGRTRRRREWA